jgi:polyene glycosyltransferase
MSAKSWDDKVYREVTHRSRFRAHHAVMKHAYRPGLWLEKYRRLESIVDNLNPALMVIDCEARFAVNLAIARKIPYVVTVPFLPSYVLASHAPFARSYVPRSFPVPLTGLPYKMSFRQRMTNRLFKLWSVAMLFDPAIAKAVREDFAIHKSIGLPPPGQLTRVEKADLVLCETIAELEYPLSVPDRFHLVGAIIPTLPEAPAGELTAWLDAHPSTVYVGLGTLTRLNRAEVASLVEVARRLGGAHQVLWKLPESQHHLLPESLPGNLRVESWVPSQLDVLAHPNVTAFVTHGGGNGFNEGLYFGKPMVVRPLWADNHDTAVRGQDKGVSLTLDNPQATDPDDVTEKLLRVLTDPAYRRRAELFASLEREAGGRETAADLVLALPALAEAPERETAV